MGLAVEGFLANLKTYEAKGTVDFRVPVQVNSISTYWFPIPFATIVYGLFNLFYNYVLLIFTFVRIFNVRKCEFVPLKFHLFTCVALAMSR